MSLSSAHRYVPCLPSVGTDTASDTDTASKPDGVISAGFTLLVLMSEQAEVMQCYVIGLLL